MADLFSFKANSHILSLLGDELIGSDNLAVFELVKNGYDADADEVNVIFNNLNTENQCIVIEDDGHGMTLDVLKNVWLEIGTSFKRGQNRKPSPKYNRISLGEKGVGRLAVHKLGKKIILETKTDGDLFSYRFEIDWKKMMETSHYIGDTKVEIMTVPENLFPKKNQGTRIIISDLKKKKWERKDFRELARKINSIRKPAYNSVKIESPHKNIKGVFDVNIKVDEPFKTYISDIKNVDDILKDAVYYFEFSIAQDGKIQWYYKVLPIF